MTTTFSSRWTGTGTPTDGSSEGKGLIRCLLQTICIAVDSGGWPLHRSVFFQLESVSDTLLTQILTTMDDDNKSTRLISCRTLTRTFDLLGSRLDQDRLHNLYPDLLKRMDDSSDEIRVVATHTFLAYFDCFQEKYEVNLYHAHLEAIYKGLLVHLDDPDPSIQQAVYGELPTLPPYG